MEEKKIRAEYDRGVITVVSEEDFEGLTSRGYGVLEDKELTLRLYEGLYLLHKGIIEVVDKNTGTLLSFEDLLNRSRVENSNAWVEYLIYRDLRSRGYVVREGFGLGINFRVYERGTYGKGTARYLIFGIQEGKPVVVEELARTLRYVQSLKKKLVLAVVSRRGEVVYYSLSQLTLKSKGGELLNEVSAA